MTRDSIAIRNISDVRSVPHPFIPIPTPSFSDDETWIQKETLTFTPTTRQYRLTPWQQGMKASHQAWVKMDDIAHTQSNDGMLKSAARVEEEEEATRTGASGSGSSQAREGDVEEAREGGGRWKRLGRKKKTYSHAHFKVYKRRWFGLAQLVLLNVVVSWDVCVGYAFLLSQVSKRSTQVLHAMTVANLGIVADLCACLYKLSNVLPHQ